MDYSISPLGQTEVSALEQTADKNNLQIDFFSVSLDGNAGTRYQYKLEGTNQDWSLPTTQGSVTFANVRPGRYRFLVRALNADDIPSTKPASMTFRILPPLWQRWWFITIVMLALERVFRLGFFDRTGRPRPVPALSVYRITEELTVKGGTGQGHRPWP